MSPLELILLLLIPELASQALLREDFSLVNALIGIATLFSLVFLSSVARYHSKKVSQVMEGQPSVLVDHGELVTRTMNQQRVGADDIFSEMHKSGLESLQQVKWAILETDGKISFIPNEPTMHQVVAGGKQKVQL